MIVNGVELRMFQSESLPDLFGMSTSRVILAALAYIANIDAVPISSEDQQRLVSLGVFASIRSPS